MRIADFCLDFFHNRSYHTCNAVVVPSIVRYGLGLPDTFPQELRLFRVGKANTAIESGSILDLAGKLYHCEIVAHFGTVRAPRDMYVDFGLSPILLPKSQFLGLQSMICCYDGEERKDVVRQRG